MKCERDDYRKGHDSGDHPPITPMRAATESELGHEAWRLYDMITRHFIATVSKASKTQAPGAVLHSALISLTLSGNICFTNVCLTVISKVLQLLHE